MFLECLVELVENTWLSSLRAGLALGIPVSPSCLPCSFAMKNICKMALLISTLCVLQQFQIKLTSLIKLNLLLNLFLVRNIFGGDSLKQNVEGKTGEW